MKLIKTIAIILMLAPAICLGQTTKKDSTKKVEKPQYEFFYKVPPGLFDFLIQASHGAKDGIIYNQLLTPQEKIQAQLNMDNSLFNIQKNIKLDSLVIKKDTTSKTGH